MANVGYQNDGVTVVIVSYNSARTIARCLDSLLGTLRDYDEVVVVDNASSDRTLAVIQSYCEDDQRIEVLANLANTGYSAAANQGADRGRNPLIAFLNPDTIVTQYWIERMIYHLEPHKTAAVGPLTDCVAGSQNLGLHLAPKQLQGAKISLIQDQLIRQYGQQSLPAKLLIGFCMMIKRKIFDELGGMDNNLFLGNDDLDLSWRLRLRGYNLVIARDAFVLHEGQASFVTQTKEITDRLVQESTDFLFYKMLEHYGPGKIPSTQRLWGIDWFRPVCRFAHHRPLTSLIMLTYNQLDFTKQCVDSILAHTQVPFELIAVDNGSTDGSLKYLKSLDRAGSACIRVHVIANEKNTGFAHGCNQGIAQSRGKYLLLINNDVVVTDGWLPRLQDAAESNPRIGLVGPMTNQISGPQLVDNPQYDTRSLRGLDRYAATYANQNKGRIANHWRLAGFCLLIKRCLVDKIGGLDTRYKIGNFEDDDYCIRAHIAGYDGAITHDCFIHHFGSQTFLGNQIDFNSQLEQNWQRFKHKWGMNPNTPYQQKYHVPLPRSGFDYAKHYIAVCEESTGTSELPNISPSQQNCENNPSDQPGSRPSPGRSKPLDQGNQPTGGVSMTILNDVYEGVINHIAPEHKAEAIWILERLVESDPQHHDAHHELGLLYYELGEHAKAQAHLQKAVELSSDNAIYLKDLGDFCHVVNEDAQTAIGLYEKAIDLKPDDHRLLLTLAHLSTTQQLFDKAAAYYRKVLDLDPTNHMALECLEKVEKQVASRSVKPDSSDLYAQAQDKVNSGDRQGALMVLEQLLSQFPDHALAHNDHGVLSYEQGDKLQALEHYQKAVRLEPDNTIFLKNLADYHWVEDQDARAALECYIKVLQHSPQDLETLLNCAQICLTLAQAEDADAFIRQALEIDPDNQTGIQLSAQVQAMLGDKNQVLDRDALYARAQTKASSGDYGGAISDLTELVTQAPTDAAAYNDLGVLHYETGDRSKALSCYRQAVELQPDQSTYLKNLADYYLMEQGRAEEAMQLYVKVLEDNPLDIDSLFASGVVCAKLQRNEDARTFFDRVLEIEPNHAAVRQAMKQMDDGCPTKSEQDSTGGIRLVRPREATA